MTTHQTTTSDCRSPRSILNFAGPTVIIWLVLGIVGSILLASAELAIAVCLQLLLKSLGILTTDVKMLTTLNDAAPAFVGGLFIAIGLVRAIAQMLVLQGSMQAQERVNARLRRLSVFDMLLNRDGRFIPASQISTQLGEVFPKAAQFVFYASQAASQGIQIGMMSLIMLYISWREALVGIAGLFVVGIGVHFVNRAVRRRAAEIPVHHQSLMHTVQKVARNWLLIRILRTQKREHSHCVDAIESYKNASLGATFLTNLTAVTTPGFGILLIVLIIVMSQSVFFSQPMALLSFLYVFVRFVQIIASFVAALGICNVYMPQFRRASDYFVSFSAEDKILALGSTVDLTPSPELAATTNVAPRVPPSLELKGVSFRYPGTEVDVVKQVTVSVGSGKQFGIVGPSGVGKSTLLSLILGILRPCEGNIVLGGESAEAYLNKETGIVGYVGAEPFLIEGSVLDNLRYGGRPTLSATDAWRALDLARMTSVVESLPGTLDYRIAENGDGLSAGQKQRLCLARAVMSSPSLLVLDEVSANLDVKTEEELADSLCALRGKCTVIIVSHRQAILKYADTIMNLEAGISTEMTS